MNQLMPLWITSYMNPASPNSYDCLYSQDYCIIADAIKWDQFRVIFPILCSKLLNFYLFIQGHLMLSLFIAQEIDSRRPNKWISSEYYRLLFLRYFHLMSDWN